MNKRVSASKILRVVSIVGIICLLALQWVWWRNAYRAVEVDFLRSSLECIKESSSKALIKQLDDKNKGFKVVDASSGDTSILKNAKFKYEPPVALNTYEMDYMLEDILNVINKPITDSMINVILSRSLRERFGNTPTYNLKIERIQIRIDSLHRPIYNRIAIGKTSDTIYHQIGFNSYTVTTISSPISYYLKKGGVFLLLSILLVVLVSIVMVFQYLSMIRERRFSVFIKDYTRMLAHELRTPVTGFQMVLQMLEKDNTPEAKKAYLQEGMGLSKKILLNLENILYMAKSEQRELPVRLMEVNMRDFMEDAVRMYRERNYNPKKVVIETHYQPADFTCRMDVELMNNVVYNLLDNAIKYTGVDARIDVTCTYENELLELRFKDNGMGIAVEDQKRIFEFLEQGSTNKRNHFSGFGIGLHFVQRVVKAHGGKISVISEVDKGAEFIIKFIS